MLKILEGYSEDAQEIFWRDSRDAPAIPKGCSGDAAGILQGFQRCSGDAPELLQSCSMPMFGFPGSTELLLGC